jgi:single-strand DNA-binding protein
MYQNKATLMGFIGNDAEVRTGKNNQKFTTFSVATKTSYKDKESGDYISQTEWHRCIVFGKFGEFAATLKKGAHVQVEGEIRHTEYTPKKAKKPVRADSIRVTSILKLDHAERRYGRSLGFALRIFKSVRAIESSQKIPPDFGKYPQIC